MEYCPRCGTKLEQGMEFCPKCGHKLTGLSLREESPYIQRSQALLKERNWFEGHLNWTMVLGFAGAYAGAFVAGLVAVSVDPYVSYDVLYIIGLILGLAVLVPVWGWALRRKSRSLWWLPLGLFVPFGFIALLVLENKSGALEVPESAH
jgi:uncharacterized membrane protein YeaQ/YmgE (transglycosylase-associated protein family)